MAGICFPLILYHYTPFPLSVSCWVTDAWRCGHGILQYEGYLGPGLDSRQD